LKSTLANDARILLTMWTLRGAPKLAQTRIKQPSKQKPKTRCFQEKDLAIFDWAIGPMSVFSSIKEGRAENN
jgi:hypothetical protein